MPKILHINLLGGFDLTYSDKFIAGTIPERLQSLLAYLVINRHLPQPWQHLAFLFWPDSSESQARTNLRRLLHDLRQVITNPNQFITIDSKSLQWRLDALFTLDVAEFEQAFAEAEAADQQKNQQLPVSLRTSH